MLFLQVRATSYATHSLSLKRRKEIGKEKG